MASRDLSVGVNLIGRDVSASKALNQLGLKAKSTGEILSSMSRKASYAIAAVGAAAVDAAKAAMEDQKSAALLANTLKNVVGANDAVVKSVEDYISKTTIATGIADDKIRPALQRLILSTKNVGQAQTLTNLAMEIATSKNMELTDVANALAKAHDGNFGALKRMGVSIDKATEKSKDFNKVQTLLEKQFKGAIAANLQTAAGKYQQMTNAINEAKESLGYALLPYIQQFSSWMVKLAPWLERNKNNIVNWGKAILGVAIAIKAVNAAYKIAKFFEIASSLLKIGAAASIAGAEGAAAGVALTASWAPWIAGILAVGAAVAGISMFFKNANKNKNDKTAIFPKNSPLNPKKPEAWNSATLGSKPLPKSMFPLYGNGGIITKPHLGIVGESGPEAIIPLNRMNALRGGVTVNVAGSVIHEKDLAITVRDNIAQLMRRRGINPSPILGV